MIYILDADTLNYAVKDVGLVNVRLRQAISAHAQIVVSQIAHFQVTRYFKLIGASRQLSVYNSIIAGWRRIELTTADWDMAADIWATRTRIGRPIENADLFIAVAALKAGATLVTNNTRHFEDLGIPLENWTM